MIEQLWRYRLSSKFRNQRQRDPKPVTEVIRRKRKIVTDGGKENVQQNEWGVVNFCPDRCSGEDDSSLLVLAGTILSEYKRVPSQRSTAKINYAKNGCFQSEEKKFWLERKL